MTYRRTATFLGRGGTALAALTVDHQHGVQVDGWQLVDRRHADLAVSILAQEDGVLAEPASADLIYASDLLVIALSAVEGVAAGWSAVWEQIEAFQRPTMIVINDLDHAHTDIDEMAAILRRMFAGEDAFQVVAFPALTDDDALGGTIDLINLTIHDGTSAPHGVRSADPEHIAFLADRRTDLVFTLASRSADVDLLDAVQAGMTPSAHALERALIDCTTEGSIIALLAIGSDGIGARQFWHLFDQVLEHTQPRLPVITPIPPRTTAPDGSPAADSLCAQVLLSDDHHSIAKLWTGALDDVHEPGGLVVVNHASPVGAVLADPPGSLSVELPAV